MLQVDNWNILQDWFPALQLPQGALSRRVRLHEVHSKVRYHQNCIWICIRTHICIRIWNFLYLYPGGSEYMKNILKRGMKYVSAFLFVDSKYISKWRFKFFIIIFYVKIFCTYWFVKLDLTSYETMCRHLDYLNEIPNQRFKYGNDFKI